MAKVVVGSITFESDTPETLFKYIERCFKRDSEYRNTQEIYNKYFKNHWTKDDAIEEQWRLENEGYNCGIWIDVCAILEWYIKYGKDKHDLFDFMEGSYET